MRKLSMLLVPGLVALSLAAAPVLTSAYAAGSDEPSSPPKSDAGLKADAKTSDAKTSDAKTSDVKASDVKADAKVDTKSKAMNANAAVTPDEHKTVRKHRHHHKHLSAKKSLKTQPDVTTPATMDKRS